MIFPNAEIEATVQVADKTRINAAKSFADKGEAAITEVRIEANTGDGFISVFDSASKNWYLDWEYSTDGTKTVSVEVTTDGAPITKTFSLEIITEVDDKLFSSDQDLINYESDILKWVQKGRNTFKNVHRLAQELILRYLNDTGYRLRDYNEITKANISNVDQLREWSTYETLRLIYNDASNLVGDEQDQKSDFYASEISLAKQKTIIELDLDGDGTIDATERLLFSKVEVTR